MRMILGLYAPTSGSVTVNGRAYDHPAPLHQVGALLDANPVHAGRVEGVIDLVGLPVEAPIGTVIPPR
jgi:ABC-type multidrug transport system ATPase subunit